MMRSPITNPPPDGPYVPNEKEEKRREKALRGPGKKRAKIKVTNMCKTKQESVANELFWASRALPGDRKARKPFAQTKKNRRKWTRHAVVLSRGSFGGEAGGGQADRQAYSDRRKRKD